MVLQVITQSQSLQTDIYKHLKSNLAKWQSWISALTSEKLLSSFNMLPNVVGEINIDNKMDLSIPKSSNKDIKVCYRITLSQGLKTLFYVCILDLELDDVNIEPYYYIIANNVPRNEFDIFEKLSRDINWYAYIAYDMVTFLGNN